MPPKVPRGPQLPSETLDWELLKKQKASLSLDHISEIAELASQYLQPEAAEFTEEDMLSHLQSLYELSRSQPAKMSKKHAKQLEKIIISVSGMPHLHFPKPVAKILEYTNRRHSRRNDIGTEGIMKIKENEKTLENAKEGQKKENEKAKISAMDELKKKFRFIDLIVDPEHKEKIGLERTDREAMRDSIDKALEVYAYYSRFQSSPEFSDALRARIAECKRAKGDLEGAAKEFIDMANHSPAGKFFIEEAARIGIGLAHAEIEKGNFAWATGIYRDYIEDLASYNLYLRDRVLNRSSEFAGRETQAHLMLELDREKEIDSQVERALDSARRGDFASAAKCYLNASMLEPYYCYLDNSYRAENRAALMEKAAGCHEKSGNMAEAAFLYVNLLKLQESELRYSRRSLLPGILRAAELMGKAGKFEEGGKFILDKTRWWTDSVRYGDAEVRDEMFSIMPGAIGLALRLFKKAGNNEGMGSCYEQLSFWDSGKEFSYNFRAARFYEKAGNLEKALDQFNRAYHDLDYRDRRARLKEWLMAKTADLEVAVSDLESTPEHLKKEKRVRAINKYLELAFKEKEGFRQRYFRNALAIIKKYGLWDDGAKFVEHSAFSWGWEFSGQSYVKTYVGLKVKAAEEAIRKGDLVAGGNIYRSFYQDKIPGSVKDKYSRLGMRYYFEAAENAEKEAIRAESEGRQVAAWEGYRDAANILWNKVVDKVEDKQQKLAIYLRAGELFLKVGGKDENHKAGLCYMWASSIFTKKKEEYARKACDLLLASDEVTSLFNNLVNLSTSERGSGKKNGIYELLHYEYLIKYGKKLEAENNLDSASLQFCIASRVLESKEKSKAARLLALNAYMKSIESKEKEGDYVGASRTLANAMEDSELKAVPALREKATFIHPRAAETRMGNGEFEEARRLYLVLSELVKNKDYGLHAIYGIKGASEDLIGTGEFRKYLEKNGGKGKRVLGAFSRLLHYGSPVVLKDEDIKSALENPAAYAQVSGFLPMGFLPMKSVLEAFSDPVRKGEVIARIKRTREFDIRDELCLQVEYCRSVPALSAIGRRSEEFALTFAEFKNMAEGKFGRFSKPSHHVAEKNELLYAGYEVLLSDGLITNIAEEAHGRVNVLGNMRLGAVYSEALEEMHENDKKFYFTLSRFGSSELHNSDYALKRELITDKKVLAGFFSSEPLVVFDASANNRMPDAFKAYRSYAAALEMMRIGESKSFLQESLGQISEQTNIPVETLEKIRGELFSDGGKFRDAMKGWFLKPERIKPFRVFEVDMNGSGVYRVSREIQGEKRRQKVSSGTPSSEDLKNFNCMMLVQSSMGDEKVPVAIKEKLGVTSQHKLAYFDDQDNVLSAMISVDSHGVDIQPSIVPQLAHAAIRVKEKLSI